MNKSCHHAKFTPGRWNSIRVRLGDVKDFLQHLEDAHEDPMEPTRPATCADTAKVVPVDESWAEVFFKPED